MLFIQNKKLSLLTLFITTLLSLSTQIQAESKDKYAQAQILHKFGRACLLSPSWSIYSAQQVFNKSLSLYRELGDQQSEADLLTWLAVVEIESRMEDDAMSYLKEAQGIYDKLNSKPGKNAAFKDVGKAMKALTLFKEADNSDKEQKYRLKKCNELLQLLREMEEKRYEGKLLFYIAYSGLVGKEDDSKFEYFNEALKIFEQIDDRRGIIAVLKSAGTHAEEKDYSKSLAYYERGFAFSQDIGYRDGKIEFVTLIGDIYSDTNNFKEALKYYKKALSIIQESEYQHSSEDDVLYKIGEMYKKMGNYKAALKAYNESKNIYENTERVVETSFLRGLFGDFDKEHLAEMYKNIGDTNCKLGNYIEAVDNLQEALKMFEGIEDSDVSKSSALATLGGVYRLLGDEETAKEYDLDNKDTERPDKKDKWEQLSFLQKQAHYFIEENKEDEALNAISRILDLSKETDDKVFERFCLSNIGFIYKFYLRNDTKALDYYKQALEVSRKHNDKAGELIALLAMEYYEHALIIAKEIGDKPSERECLSAIGEKYFQQKKYEKAEEYFKNVLIISKDMHDPVQILNAQYDLYSLAIMTGQYQKAKNYLSEAISTIESIREKISVEKYKSSFISANIDIYNEMIALLGWLGEYEEAFNYVERAKSRALLDVLGNKVKLGKGKNKELNQKDTRLQQEIKDLLGKIRKEQSEPEEKQENNLKKWKEKLKHARKEYAKHLLDIKKKDYELYSLVSVNPLTLREVQELLEPDTTLLEYYVLSGIKPEYNLNGLYCWVVTKNDFELFGFPMEKPELTSTITNFREKIATLQPDYEKEAEELYDLLIRQAKPYIKTKKICIVPHSVLHFLPFQALLNVPEFSGLHIAVDQIDGMLTVLFVMEGSVAHKAGLKVGDKIVAIEETPTINMSFEEICNIIYGEPSTSILLEIESGESKAHRTVRLEREIISKTRFFSELHKFKFPKLRDNKSKSIKNKAETRTCFLIEEYDIFYAPSASVLKFVLEKRKKGSGSVLAFGNPEFADEDRNLPHAEEEVKRIKESYPETTFYLKERATEGRAKSLSGNYDIIHFASHGELNSQSPLFSCIKMAKGMDEDGRLEVHEIFNLDLKNASLVTLSACETGLGRLSSGDELIGLTRGFIYAGTPSIVASLWNVNDKSTSDLMSLFYKNLKTHSKVEALRMAQLEMINGEAGRGIVRGVGGITTSEDGADKPQAQMTVDGSHPYFWAPFILLGDWK